MRIFVTGCGVAVPLSTDPSAGFVNVEAAREACVEPGDNGLKRLLTAQTHEQAKATCVECPWCGPVAPHLGVDVGNDRVRMPAEEPAAAPEIPAGFGLQSVFADLEAQPELPLVEAPPVPTMAVTVGIGAARATISPEPVGNEPVAARGLPVPEQPAPEPEPAPTAQPDWLASFFAGGAQPAPAAEPAPEPPPPEPVQPPPPEPVAAPAAAPDAGAMFDAAMTHPTELPPMKSLTGVDTGPSIMGSSTLRAFQLCMRAGFYKIVKGIRRHRQVERPDDRGGWKFNPLELGTLVHAILASFYEGVENPFVILDRVAPYYPNIAAEARRLCTNYFNAFAERDRQTLDVRFVEMESRLYFRKKRVKSAKKNMALCISSKHDLGFRKMGFDEPRLPPGVAASGITIMDHKCLAPDEEVCTPHGTVTARACLKRGSVSVLAYDLANAAQHSTNALFSDNGQTPCVRIQTKSGRTLHVTSNHPVYTARGWLEADGLELRDCVLVAAPQMEAADAADDLKVSEHSAIVLGLLVGDGTIDNDRVMLHSKRAKLHDWFRQHAVRFADGVEWSERVDDRNGVITTRLQGALPALRQFQLCGVRAAAKFIPPAILHGNIANVRFFLRALWSTDGFVRPRGRRDIRCVYSTRSARLARDVQRALWRLGVWSTKRNFPVSYNGSKRDYWQVTVSGARAKKRFADSIISGMVLRHPSDRAELLQRAAALPVNAVTDDTVRWRANGGVEPPCGSVWDPIEKLSYSLQADTVSISMRDTNVFLSGDGIVSHNTAAAVTQDLQNAYRHDPQLFTNAVTYMQGNSVENGVVGAPSAERFGPMTHFTINIIGKALYHDPEKHLVRLTQILPKDLLESYTDDIQHWLYTELADRLFHPAAEDDATWPKSYLCRDPSTGRPCAYIEICERGGLKGYDPRVNFTVGEQYDPSRLLKPDPPKKKRGRKAKAAAEVESK